MQTELQASNVNGVSNTADRFACIHIEPVIQSKTSALYSQQQWMSCSDAQNKTLITLAVESCVVCTL